MPYDTVRSPKCPRSKPFALVARDSGKVMGCHATAARANGQRAAILANEKQLKVGEGRGHYRHLGIPGHQGGSLPASAGLSLPGVQMANPPQAATQVQTDPLVDFIKENGEIRLQEAGYEMTLAEFVQWWNDREDDGLAFWMSPSGTMFAGDDSGEVGHSEMMQEASDNSDVGYTDMFDAGWVRGVINSDDFFLEFGGTNPLTREQRATLGDLRTISSENDVLIELVNGHYDFPSRVLEGRQAEMRVGMLKQAKELKRRGFFAPEHAGIPGHRGGSRHRDDLTVEELNIGYRAVNGITYESVHEGNTLFEATDQELGYIHAYIQAKTHNYPMPLPGHSQLTEQRAAELRKRTDELAEEMAREYLDSRETTGELSVQVADQKSLGVIVAEVYHEEWDQEASELALSAAAAASRHPDWKTYIVFDGKNPVSIIASSLFETGDSSIAGVTLGDIIPDGKYLYVHMIASEEGHRGYGTRAMLQALRDAVRAGAGMAGTSVDGALGFYEKLGADFSKGDGNTTYLTAQQLKAIWVNMGEPELKEIELKVGQGRGWHGHVGIPGHRGGGAHPPKAPEVPAPAERVGVRHGPTWRTNPRRRMATYKKLSKLFSPRRGNLSRRTQARLLFSLEADEFDRMSWDAQAALDRIRSKWAYWLDSSYAQQQWPDVWAYLDSSMSIPEGSDLGRHLQVFKSNIEGWVDHYLDVQGTTGVLSTGLVTKDSAADLMVMAIENGSWQRDARGLAMGGIERAFRRVFGTGDTLSRRVYQEFIGYDGNHPVGIMTVEWQTLPDGSTDGYIGILASAKRGTGLGSHQLLRALSEAYSRGASLHGEPTGSARPFYAKVAGEEQIYQSTYGQGRLSAERVKAMFENMGKPQVKAADGKLLSLEEFLALDDPAVIFASQELLEEGERLLAEMEAEETEAKEGEGRGHHRHRGIVGHRGGSLPASEGLTSEQDEEEGEMSEAERTALGSKIDEANEQVDTAEQALQETLGSLEELREGFRHWAAINEGGDVETGDLVTILEQAEDNLRNAIGAAEDLASVTRGVGETAGIGARLEAYLIGHLRSWLEQESQSGSLAELRVGIERDGEDMGNVVGRMDAYIIPHIRDWISDERQIGSLASVRLELSELDPRKEQKRGRGFWGHRGRPGAEGGSVPKREGTGPTPGQAKKPTSGSGTAGKPATAAANDGGDGDGDGSTPAGTAINPWDLSDELGEMGEAGAYPMGAGILDEAGTVHYVFAFPLGKDAKQADAEALGKELSGATASGGAQFGTGYTVKKVKGVWTVMIAVTDRLRTPAEGIGKEEKLLGQGRGHWQHLGRPGHEGGSKPASEGLSEDDGDEGDEPDMDKFKDELKALLAKLQSVDLKGVSRMGPKQWQVRLDRHVQGNKRVTYYPTSKQEIIAAIKEAWKKAGGGGSWVSVSGDDIFIGFKEQDMEEKRRGHFRHRGRPGHEGGSLPASAGLTSAGERSREQARHEDRMEANRISRMRAEAARIPDLTHEDFVGTAQSDIEKFNKLAAEQPGGVVLSQISEAYRGRLPTFRGKKVIGGYSTVGGQEGVHRVYLLFSDGSSASFRDTSITDKRGYTAASSVLDKLQALKAKEQKMDEGYAAEPPSVAVVSSVPLGATSFREVDEYMDRMSVNEEAKRLLRDFQTLAENIMFSETVQDRSAAMASLVAEFQVKLAEAVGGRKSLFKTVVDSVKELVGLEKSQAPAVRQPFMVWKSAAGYRWFAVYSNKYRDEDHPPEILASQAHKSFVDKVDAGRLPYPVLLHYHVPGSRWGKSDWLAYDDTGFVMASGTVDPGHEKEAEAVMALKQPLAVSHGLEVMRRNPVDRSIIEEYETYEISDLPLVAAANKLTGFTVLEEGAKEMGIPAQKKDYLKKVGLDDADIARIEADIEGKSVVAEEAGLESKQAEIEKPAEQPGNFATKEEVSEAIVAAVAPLTEAVSVLTSTVTTMAKSQEEAIASKAADTPALSIAALVTKQLSAIGKDSTRLTVDQMALAKDKPQETEPTARSTGIPFIDGILADKPKS